MPRVIKRYSNRKLYDTEASIYVSLREIAALVRNGETIQVVDNDSGEDLTTAVLTRIILKEGKRGNALISSTILHDLLRRSNDVIDASVEQVRHNVDSWMRQSVRGVNALLAVPSNDQVDAIQAQLDHITELLDDVAERVAPSAEADSASK